MHIDPVQFFTPAFVLLVIGEMLFVRFGARGSYEQKDTAASLSLALGSVIFGAIYGLAIVWFAGLVTPWRIASVGWSTRAVVICFVFDDLIYYSWHRTAHRVRWFWAEHVTHHSSQHYNLSTALRQPWGAFLTPTVLFKAPLLLLGFPLGMIALTGGLNLVYQFWIHTETIGKLPRWFEAVMNTPSHHRVHHAANACYLDANYAGTFIVWDRLFGTFVQEDEAEKPRYGIVRNLGTFNPLRAAFHEFASMMKDVMTAKNLHEAAGYLLAPPGWSPDGTRETSDSMKARWQRLRVSSLPAV